MRWLLDTNVLIDAFAGRPDSVKAITSARTANLEWIGYSAVTRLEVLGFPGLNAADESGLRNLLAQFSEAPIDDAVIEASWLESLAVASPRISHRLGPWK